MRERARRKCRVRVRQARREWRAGFLWGWASVMRLLLFTFAENAYIYRNTSGLRLQHGHDGGRCVADGQIDSRSGDFSGPNAAAVSSAAKTGVGGRRRVLYKDARWRIDS